MLNAIDLQQLDHTRIIVHDENGPRALDDLRRARSGRHLARLDQETTYFLFCHDADEATLRDLAPNFVPVVDRSAGYGVREHLTIPLKLRRLGAELLHSPHYVRPLLCTIPSVVTIHDCIHLLFPQYLPNRMAWRYARYMMGSAIRHSAVVFTVSEASRADILRFYPWADPQKVHVVPNAIDTELLEDGAADADRRTIGILGQQQAENQVYGLAIRGIEVHRLVQLDECSRRAGKTGTSAMR